MFVCIHLSFINWPTWPFRGPAIFLNKSRIFKISNRIKIKITKRIWKWSFEIDSRFLRLCKMGALRKLFQTSFSDISTFHRLRAHSSTSHKQTYIRTKFRYSTYHRYIIWLIFFNCVTKLKTGSTNDETLYAHAHATCFCQPTFIWMGSSISKISADD